MNLLFQSITSLVEWQRFGWNWLTVGVLATFIFTLSEAWGLWEQNKVIWEEQSGESLVNTWFVYFPFMFASFIVYGGSVKAAALIFNGLLCLLFIPINIGLAKFKGFSHGDRLAALLSFGALLLMIFLPIKGIMFLLFSAGGILALMREPIELWRTRRRGVLEIKLVWIFLTSYFFWTIYAIALGDKLLLVITSLTLIILSLTVILWYQAKISNRPGAK